MLFVLLLFSLLLAAVEVNAAPFDKGSHQEEMVTRCIVEVLSNALAKPNAPPIDPECKEILKKSSRHNQEEKYDEPQKYETNANLDKRQHDHKEETKTDLPKEENEEKRHHAESESREEKQVEDVKEMQQSEEEERTGHSKERSFVEDEDDEEEKLDHEDHYEKEEVEKRNKYHDQSHEAEHDMLDKKNYASKNTEEFPGEDDIVKNLEDIIKRHPLQKIWKEQLFHPEKYHSVHSDEVSEESDDHKEEKRSYKPNHVELRHKLFNPEEKKSNHEEPRNHIASAEKTSHFRGQKPHYVEPSMLKHLIKDDIDKRSHHEKESSEESREKRQHHRESEEEAEHQSSEESHEKVLDSPHYEDKRQHEERKRWPSQQNSRLNYEQSSEENEEDIDKRQEQESSEKENFYKKLKHHLQGSDDEEPFRQDKKQDKNRHYIGEEMVDEMKRYYPGYSNENFLRPYEDSKNKNYREDSEETSFPDTEMYRKNQVEENRRAANKNGFSSDPLRWRSRYFENMDNSEEDRKRSLQVKNIFPDYNDYDLWGKRQFLDDLNHEYGERRSPAKTHKFEEKRQYDKMDELTQLLNYKKKSAEFPDFYDSEEIKKRHYDERGRFNQRPLTEEEEKELENLALMDLELQKIAEKLSNNRQG